MARQPKAPVDPRKARLHRASQEQGVEAVYMVMPHQYEGVPLQEGYQYEVAPSFADGLYKRGLARPAAEVYLERLQAMGLRHITVSADAELSLKQAADRLGIHVSIAEA